MTKQIIGILVIGGLGIYFMRLGVLQLKSGVAWANNVALYGPATRGGSPFFYWMTVASNLFIGGILCFGAISMLVG